MAKLTAKQQRFVDEYLIDCNATQAAIRAGYSEKTARSIGQQNLTKLDIIKAIEERMKSKEQETIATQDEVLKFFSSVMRGEPQQYSSENIKQVDDGVEKKTTSKGYSTPALEERLDAAKELAKRHRLYDNSLLEEERLRKAKADADIAESKAKTLNESGDKVAQKVDKLFDKLIDEVD